MKDWTLVCFGKGLSVTGTNQLLLFAQTMHGSSDMRV